MKHLHNSQIASSCVVFQELVGHDSLLLRMYVHAGNDVLQHRNNAVTGTVDKRREQLKRNEQEVGMSDEELSGFVRSLIYF